MDKEDQTNADLSMKRSPNNSKYTDRIVLRKKLNKARLKPTRENPKQKENTIESLSIIRGVSFQEANSDQKSSKAESSLNIYPEENQEENSTQTYKKMMK